MIYRTLLVLITIFSIVIFGPMVLDVLMSKNKCEKAALEYSASMNNPEVTREQKIQLRKKFEGVCKEMGVKSEVYSSMFSGK